MHASPHARGDRYGRHSNYAARPAQPNVETLRRPAAAASQLAAKTGSFLWGFLCSNTTVGC